MPPKNGSAPAGKAIAVPATTNIDSKHENIGVVS